MAWSWVTGLTPVRDWSKDKRRGLGAAGTDVKMDRSCAASSTARSASKQVSWLQIANEEHPGTNQRAAVGGATKETG